CPIHLSPVLSNVPATPSSSTLSLHDALPILRKSAPPPLTPSSTACISAAGSETGGGLRPGRCRAGAWSGPGCRVLIQVKVPPAPRRHHEWWPYRSSSDEYANTR